MLKDIKCPLCKNQKSCAIMGIGDYAVEKCGMFNLIEKPIKTHADEIRSMSDEELALWIHSEICKAILKSGPGWTADKWLKWLKQEVEDRET